MEHYWCLEVSLEDITRIIVVLPVKIIHKGVDHISGF